MTFENSLLRSVGLYYRLHSELLNSVLNKGRVKQIQNS